MSHQDQNLAIDIFQDGLRQHLDLNASTAKFWWHTTNPKVKPHTHTRIQTQTHTQTHHLVGEEYFFNRPVIALDISSHFVSRLKPKTALRQEKYNQHMGRQIKLPPSIFTIVKTQPSWWILRLCLIRVTAAELQWHVSNMNVIQGIQQVL